MNFSERFNQTKKCCIFNRLLLSREGLWKFHFSFVAPVLPSQQECSDHDPVYAAVPRLPRPPRHVRADEDFQCGVRGEGGHYARGHALHVPGHPDAAWRSGVCPHPPAPNHLHPLNPELATCGRTFTATRPTRAAQSAAYPQCRNRNIAGTRGQSSRERRSGGNRLRTVWSGGSGEGGAAHDHNIRRQTVDGASDATEALHTKPTDLLPHFINKKKRRTRK